MDEPLDAVGRTAARADLATRLFFVFVTVMLVASLAILAFLAVQDHRRQRVIEAQSVENGRLAEAIRDCTTPGGDCYQRSRQASADAVGSINRVTVIAAACAVGINADLPVAERERLIRACLTERLQEP